MNGFMNGFFDKKFNNLQKTFIFLFSMYENLKYLIVYKNSKNKIPTNICRKRSVNQFDTSICYNTITD